jgi:hypothetical protein
MRRPAVAVPVPIALPVALPVARAWPPGHDTWRAAARRTAEQAASEQADWRPADEADNTGDNGNACYGIN